MLPAGLPAPFQPFCRSWPRARTTVHPTTPVAHRRSAAALALTRLRAAPGGLERSPGGLLLFSQPRRCAWGSSLIATSRPPPPGDHCPHDRLTAGRRRHVFDDHALLTTFALQFRHGLELLDEQAHQADCPVRVRLRALLGLLRGQGPPEKLGGRLVSPNHLRAEQSLRRVGRAELAEERYRRVQVVGRLQRLTPREETDDFTQHHIGYRSRLHTAQVGRQLSGLALVR